MSSEAHAWPLSGSIQGLHPIYRDIARYPRQRYTVAPSQGRGPNTNVNGFSLHPPVWQWGEHVVALPRDRRLTVMTAQDQR